VAGAIIRPLSPNHKPHSSILRHRHNDRAKNNAGGLPRELMPRRLVTTVKQEVAEKMIRKLRSGMMPPNARRPEAAVLASFAASMESRLDQQPLNRIQVIAVPASTAPNTRAVSALLSLDVDVNILPPDTSASSFDKWQTRRPSRRR
jgi:hypothetical protein